MNICKTDDLEFVDAATFYQHFKDTDHTKFKHDGKSMKVFTNVKNELDTEDDLVV